MRMINTSLALRIGGGMVLLSLLGACSDNQQARAGGSGNTSASSLTYYSKTPADDEPVVTPMEITGISCDTDSDTVQTRVDLGEEGYVLVRDDHRWSDPAWLIEVNLARLDIPGGKRDNIHPERETASLTLDRNGDIEGHYQFQLYGDMEGMYAVELDISC